MSYHLLSYLQSPFFDLPLVGPAVLLVAVAMSFCQKNLRCLARQAPGECRLAKPTHIAFGRLSRSLAIQLTSVGSSSISEAIELFETDLSHYLLV